eukprot:gnl/Hemi2/25998_TR8732_c0_g1_i1.p2 gnl/Hemi2/25998_TR8732_c0_g1~~gnl/Hemi2/25998_TR8732_c0_g1_i1.p2  ORF type:complete len:105 (+),score=29.68 gnl/Hemi2/25998_TR8732_c0_g1_i1:238-552(+)
MVNLADAEIQGKPGFYSPDGGYIPRIIFAYANGHPMTKVINSTGDDRFKYYYTTEEAIVLSMKEALHRFATDPEMERTAAVEDAQPQGADEAKAAELHSQHPDL